MPYCMLIKNELLYSSTIVINEGRKILDDFHKLIQNVGGENNRK